MPLQISVSALVKTASNACSRKATTANFEFATRITISFGDRSVNVMSVSVLCVCLPTCVFVFDVGICISESAYWTHA